MLIFQKNNLQFIKPNWPVDCKIKALTTTRIGQDSKSPYESFNLATHVGDDANQVARNRGLLSEVLALPSEPVWLDQQHTTKALQVDCSLDVPKCPADATWTLEKNTVLAVMTADCLPLLVTDFSGSLVCAIHAGWRGLLEGVVSNTIRQLPVSTKTLMVWVGPAISQQYFEIGEEVYQSFIQKQPEHQQYFQKHPETPGKYYASLPGLVDFELKELGINSIYHSELCSYERSDWFYSYRRDGVTGRMASLIWLTD